MALHFRKLGRPTPPLPHSSTYLHDLHVLHGSKPHGYLLHFPTPPLIYMIYMFYTAKKQRDWKVN